MGAAEKRVCLNCGAAFIPEARNARHQRYCGLEACKAASKRASQARWLAKPENQDYHRGPGAVARVQAWRADHPGYSRREEATAPAPLQEVLALSTDASAQTTSPTTQDEQAILPPSVKTSCNAPAPPLQDVLSAQPIVLVGLIAHLWGSALQEDIASALSRLIELGQDIRGGNHEHHQTGLEPGTPAPGARALQLGRSSPGAGTHHREG